MRRKMLISTLSTGRVRRVRAYKCECVSRSTFCLSSSQFLILKILSFSLALSPLSYLFLTYFSILSLSSPNSSLNLLDLQLLFLNLISLQILSYLLQPSTSTLPTFYFCLPGFSLPVNHPLHHFNSRPFNSVHVITHPHIFLLKLLF